MRSIFLKIFLWFWLAMVLIGLAFAFLWNLQTESSPTPRSLTVQAATMYAASAEQTFETGGAPATNQLFQRLRERSGIDAVLLNADLQPIAGEVIGLDFRLAQKTAASGQPQIEFNGNFADVATVGQSASGRKYIFLARLPHRIPGMFHGSAANQALHWSVAILISGLVCYTLTRYLIQPILRLRTAAGTIAAGDFSARVAPRLANRRDEIGELVRDFNQMAERTERLMETQQQLLRDISHELRSPLARLNVALELARNSAGEKAAPALDRIEQESERLNEMIGRLLTLARIKTLVDPPQHTSVPLRPMIDEIAQDAGFEAVAKHCRVEVGGAQECEVHGSPELLRSAVENVVRNAVRYSPEGGAVQIGLHCNGSIARITVSDEGPGVPAAEVDKIFRPFYRLSDAREHRSGGTGIGLAITQEVARLHAGRVSARNVQPHGLVVEMELPCTGERKALKSPASG